MTVARVDAIEAILPVVAVDRDAGITVDPKTAPLRIVHVAPSLPRPCGISTFAADVARALSDANPGWTVDTCQVRRAEEAPVGPLSVIEGDRASYVRAAREIEAAGADILLIEHEFGLYGGPGGDALLGLVDRVAMPIVVTFHTMLDNPGPDEERVMRRLIARASKLNVMSQRSRDTLLRRYGASAERTIVIEHGVPDRPFGRTEAMKAQLALSGPVMLTFGLLSPGKGIETAIRALPQILAANPQVTYCIAGATHPNLVAREGEAYRESLEALARSLGVDAAIRWIDRFLEKGELLDLIEAADVYLTPYPNPAQSTSGTLSYAVALGKAVVSTPYTHASELLGDGTGVLVPFGDGAAIASAVNALLGDPDWLDAVKARAYARGRTMTWEHYGANLARAMGEVRVVARSRRPRVADRLPLEGLLRLCDDCGMLQHSRGLIPDRRHGYCIDDNARALILFNRLPAQQVSQAGERAIYSFAAFIDHAWNRERRLFRNFMSYGREWLEEEGSEDSNGRTLWALGATAIDARDPALRAWATELYNDALPSIAALPSPRATAFAMLGMDAFLDAQPDHAPTRACMRAGLDRLIGLLDGNRRPDWPWFEMMLAYDNPRLPEALIRCGSALDDRHALSLGLETLNWIRTQQTGRNGQFRPVGSESFGAMGEPPMPFDQQPLEAQAMIEACSAALHATRDPSWARAAWAAYDWFFGSNDRGAMIGDARTGACFDGLTPHGPNLNSGAESVLAFHLATLAIRGLSPHSA